MMSTDKNRLKELYIAAELKYLQKFKKEKKTQMFSLEIILNGI